MPDESMAYPAEVVEAAQKFDYQQKAQEAAKQGDFPKAAENELPVAAWTITGLRDEWLAQNGGAKENTYLIDLSNEVPSKKVGVRKYLDESGNDKYTWFNSAEVEIKNGKGEVFGNINGGANSSFEIKSYQQALEKAQDSLAVTNADQGKLVKVINYQDKGSYNDQSGKWDAPRQVIILMNPQDFQAEIRALEKIGIRRTTTRAEVGFATSRDVQRFAKQEETTVARGRETDAVDSQTLALGQTANIKINDEVKGVEIGTRSTKAFLEASRRFELQGKDLPDFAVSFRVTQGRNGEDLIEPYVFPYCSDRVRLFYQTLDGDGKERELPLSGGTVNPVNLERLNNGNTDPTSIRFEVSGGDRKLSVRLTQVDYDNRSEKIRGFRVRAEKI